MKKNYILLSILAMGFTNAQNEEELRGRIGINTYYPKAYNATAILPLMHHCGVL